MRVTAPPAKFELLAQPGSDRSLVAEDLDRTRAAWLQVAAHEHVALTALNGDMRTPTYFERFDTLGDAIASSATGLLCAGRLAMRPEAFHTRVAWAHQAFVISRAFEAYTGTLRGLEHAEPFARTQRAVLTRLIRAAAALAIIELRPQRRARRQRVRRTAGRRLTNTAGRAHAPSHPLVSGGSGGTGSAVSRVAAARVTVKAGAKPP